VRVLCLGGNVCLGARSIRGWPEHLWGLTQWQIVNEGIPGGRAIDVSRRVASLPKWREDPDWIVVQLGTYDARGGVVSPREWGLMLEQILDSVTDRWPDASILVCSPPPIYQSTVKGFNRHARRWIPRASLVSEEITEVAGHRWLNLSDLPPAMFPDGIHPNRDGCKEIAARVRDAIA